MKFKKSDLIDLAERVSNIFMHDCSAPISIDSILEVIIDWLKEHNVLIVDE